MADPQLLGAHNQFSAAKKKFFDILAEERTKMRGSVAFIEFWQSIVVDIAMATPLGHYVGTVLLACPTSCDAEPCQP